MIDSTDKNSLIKIAKTITNANLSESDKALFVSECILQKLMITNLPFASRVMLRLVFKLKGYDSSKDVLAVSIFSEADKLLEDVLYYLVHGKDSNTSSAGGFNQQELYILQSILTHYEIYI